MMYHIISFDHVSYLFFHFQTTRACMCARIGCSINLLYVQPLHAISIVVGKA